MKLLITGAFGNLGFMCIEQALGMGHDVVAFDLDTSANRKLATQLANRVDVRLGDLRDPACLGELLDDVDAIVHNASVLPPITENSPELAHEINVEACKGLIALAETHDPPPVFVFPSSLTVFGLAVEGESPRTIHDPVEATDHYTRHKLAIEQALAESTLPWVVLRVGVAVDARTLSTDRHTFKQLLDVRPDNPLEWVHPKDVALAMCRAASTDEAKRKILLIAGGPSCRVTQGEFLSTAFEALGLSLPASCHGTAPYYTHWMDTTESQRMLDFQHHGFSDYRREMTTKLRFVRRALWPLRWLVQPLLPAILNRL